MLSYKLILKLFGFTSKHNLIATNRLAGYRKINSAFHKAIDNNYSVLRNLHKTYNKIRNILKYDQTDYNNQFYKRLLLKRALVNRKTEYYNLKMPIVKILPDEDIGDQYVIKHRKLPDSYYLFLQLYEEFPSTRIKLYSVDVVQNVFNSQYEYLQNAIMNMINSTELDNIIMFTPVCYVKHFKLDPTDNQYIMLICFVNVVDSELNHEFPFINERFCTIKLDLDDLENNELHFAALLNHLEQMTEKIKIGAETMLIPRNIATQLGSFDSMFNELINHQVFNI